MNKIKVLLPMAVAAFALSACSSDETVEDLQPKKAINFNVRTENSMLTKATPITSSNFTDGSMDFEVWAFNGTEAYMGNATDGTWIKHTTTSTGSSASDNGSGYWDYANTDKVEYWPGTTLNFFAISPAHDGFSSIKPNVTNDSKTFEYYADVNNSNQKDVMVATASAAASPVTLPFRHALSQIVFAGRVANDNLQATIENIILHNIKNGGTCTFDASTITWADKSAVPASENATSTVTYTASPKTDATTASDNTNVITSTDYVAITGEGGTSPKVIDPLLLRPQDFSGSGSVTQTAPTDGTPYVEISYKLQQKNEAQYIKGSATTWATIYVPLKTSWVAGSKYIYNLTFSADVITFNCTVGNWTDATIAGQNI